MRCNRIFQHASFHRVAFGLMLALLCTAAAAPPQETTFEIDPSQSKVQFTVDSTLHTVHGVFRLKPGSMRFDSAGGPAEGQMVVDAASGDSGNKSRDHKMTKDILEADKYPEIVFTPQRMKGTLAPAGSSQIQLEGVLSLHGQTHPLTLDVKTEVQGSSLSADTSFTIPFIQWGLRNPSTLFLRVSDKVEIHIHAVGQLKSPATSTPVSPRPHR
jgi:polyisoprenoid-binding protein YceI